ncbi:MAG: undecaprenyl-diphosphate phosphatase [Planctomycetota bacterium]|jgi:undecaprenyl-diphosphatase
MPVAVDAGTLDYLSAALYGLIQGLTEFLPVSSSGHLALADHLGLSQSGNQSGPPVFDVLLHLATALVVIKGFWRTLIKVGREERGVLINVMVASIPVAIVGLCFEEEIGSLRNSPVIVCLSLLCTAAFLWVCESVPTYPHPMKDLTPRNALIVGMAQALAIVPGISRSGLTITGGVVCGLDRGAAVTFSFLLMLPAVLGANLLKLVKHWDQWAELSPGPASLGFFTALISGAIGLRILQHLVNARKLKGFALYCAIIGTTGILYFTLLA